jgi:hypothetical protein
LTETVNTIGVFFRSLELWKFLDKFEESDRPIFLRVAEYLFLQVLRQSHTASVITARMEQLRTHQSVSQDIHHSTSKWHTSIRATSSERVQSICKVTQQDKKAANLPTGGAAMAPGIAEQSEAMEDMPTAA